MKHVPQRKEQLIELLEVMLEGVRSGDTMEGMVSFVQPIPPDEPCDFMVHAVLRTGNLMGQGSMIILERMEPGSTSTEAGEPK